MATSKDTIAFILEILGGNPRFFVRAMFGEYALYADGKVVALVCDDMLYVKILPASASLAGMCEQAPPYPSAKPYYVITEEQLHTIENMPNILIAVAAELPVKK